MDNNDNGSSSFGHTHTQKYRAQRSSTKHGKKHREEDRVQETTTPTGLYVAEPAIAIPSSHSARWPKGGERPCGDYTVLDDAMAPEI